MPDTPENSMLTHSQDDDLAAACNDWQGGRNVGSSPLRAAARVLTGTRHYFTADYIDKYERRAAADTGLLNQARVLLGAVATAPIQTAEQWAETTGVTGSLRSVGFAGRGLVARSDEDEQITDAVASGRLAMPLWGVSLDLDQAIAYGGSPRSGGSSGCSGRSPRSRPGRTRASSRTNES
jgi:hypothetical protein